MATYYPYLSNQTEVLSSPYIRDQMYLSQASSPSSYTEHFSTDTLQPRNEVEFISQMGNSMNFEPNEGDQILSSHALSLSLGTQFPPSINVPTYEYQYASTEGSPLLSPNIQLEYDFEAYKSSSPMPNICNLKYMKAAQELLDEVVCVQKGIKLAVVEKQRKISKFELFGSKEMEMKTNCESSTKACPELSSSERQHLKVNLGNLCSMVDEVDRKYRRYCHQMQIVVSSFETMAGRGAATPYTALALCTISRQFRSLRDSINAQITMIRQSLGEKDASVEGKLTRLRVVDQQLRQQAAFQQFGTMRNSWRPQRGLPGNSVSILRAWLFENFLHPYPKDSEKIMLSRQTGLTRGQVANWFINARVRLWKPMVEEMYKEEFGDMDTNSSPDPSPRTPTKDKAWASLKNTKNEIEISDKVTETGDDSKPTLIPTVGLKGCTARLGFQNGPQEQIKVDFDTMPPNHTTSDVNSALIASTETQFDEDYNGEYQLQTSDTNLFQIL